MNALASVLRSKQVLSKNLMTALAQELLNTFDALPNAEQLEIALAILRRLVNLDFPPLTDDDLALNAEALFLALDEQEADYEQP